MRIFFFNHMQCEGAESSMGVFSRCSGIYPKSLVSSFPEEEETEQEAQFMMTQISPRQNLLRTAASGYPGVGEKLRK